MKISIGYNSLKDIGLLAQQSAEGKRTGTAGKFPVSCGGVRERNKNRVSFALPHALNCDSCFTQEM
jgi:hypothetical protein